MTTSLDPRDATGASRVAASERADAAGERARVRAAYARRAEDDARYSWYEPAHQLAVQGIERALLDALRRELDVPLGRARFVEVGCGRGAWLQRLVSWGATPARVHGVELLEDRLMEARARTPPGVTLTCASAAALPIADSSIDVALQVTAFSSMLDVALRAAAAAELRRVVRPGGLVLWYDLRVDNPRNPDVRGIGRAELRALFPGWVVRARARTLAPPLARPLARRAWWLAVLLSRVPLLCTHCLAVARAPGAGESHHVAAAPGGRAPRTTS